MTVPAAAADAALMKARRRLIPLLFLIFFIAYIDRINVGFAALQMNGALGFSTRTYSFGAGIFFLSYALFEIPSNVILARVGARVWLARIMISWGVLSAAMLLVRGPVSFYVLRFLLGAAEAGSFPGIIFFLTQWFPAAERARTVAGFMTSIVAAGVIGSPLSGALLSLRGSGLDGWQWLFLVEGLPAIALGLVVLRALPERPADAAWLAPDERRALQQCLDEDARGRPASAHSVGDALRERRTWLLAAIYFAMPVANYGVGFFLPLMVKAASGASNLVVGGLTAIPYAVAAVAMIASGRHSDRTGERRWHIVAAAVVCAAGLILTTRATGVIGTVASLSLAMAGVMSMFGPFWAVATSPMRGVGAAASIALINSIGNTGGFVGPFLLGAIDEATHSFSAGLFAIAGLVIAMAVAVVVVLRNVTRQG